MCYWILPTSGIPIVQSTVQPITEEQHRIDETKHKLTSLDEQILNKLGESFDDDPLYDLNNLNITAEDLPDSQYAQLEPLSSMPEAYEWDTEAFVKYISAEVMLLKDNEYILGKVVGRKDDRNGNPIGQANNNPNLDTQVYDIIFPNGSTLEYSANMITECLYS
jgi:hypothetical protein